MTELDNELKSADKAASEYINIFIDESIHDRGNLIVIAAVFRADNLQELVGDALLECGFDSARDEFKSSVKMAGNPAAQRLRDRLKHILGTCKIAVAICPVSERAAVVEHAGRLLSGLNGEALEPPATVYFDGGMKRALLELPEGITPIHGCDSKWIAGIQVADCAAYLVSMMLLAELGIVTKTVPASTVYPGDEGEIELAWTLWAAVRYALSSGNPVGGYDEDGWCEPLMHPFGLLVSDGC
ncbi:DUF3800 domain-containing protein [Microvirga aerilata]|uniref:DUF3800 domain-containing protein n=1 Tax=Microvirga aerilata TaxID=670292 RepID=A0A937CZ42_9HYPH|nr:DUF3800 domain-containing protein [Microvirga aerilata]MBL0407773.1 DUF3800 domain-containing protein [Microvirga aerilata]